MKVSCRRRENVGRVGNEQSWALAKEYNEQEKSDTEQI